MLFRFIIVSCWMLLLPHVARTQANAAFTLTGQVEGFADISWQGHGGWNQFQRSKKLGFLYVIFCHPL